MKTWDDLTPREKAALGYSKADEEKLIKDRENWNVPKPERGDEYISHKDSSGEQSPYWDWVNEHAPHNSEGEPMETRVANPDSLSSDDTTVSDLIIPVEEKDKAIIEVNRLAKIYLTKSEFLLWDYARKHSSETWEKIAENMGFSARYVRSLLNRIRKKLSGHFKK